MGNLIGSGITTETKKNFDPSRYAGEWHEIGKYYLFWEKDCYSAKAIYTFDAIQNIIKVENQCLASNGNILYSRFGEARIPDLNDKSKLLLKFTDGLPADIGESPYWVFDTDYDNYSIVGGPSGKYLWILSRKPTMRAMDVIPLLEKIRSYGYDPDRLMGNKGAITM